jgi:hypothetical protein
MFLFAGLTRMLRERGLASNSMLYSLYFQCGRNREIICKSQEEFCGDSRLEFLFSKSAALSAIASSQVSGPGETGLSIR